MMGSQHYFHNYWEIHHLANNHKLTWLKAELFNDLEIDLLLLNIYPPFISYLQHLFYTLGGNILK